MDAEVSRFLARARAVLDDRAAVAAERPAKPMTWKPASAKRRFTLSEEEMVAVLHLIETHPDLKET